ncbi:hypothetical protein CISIN_1g001070mg [Citrus sinensis]|uniref:Enhancer of mRNA-decapping protein 4 C-terminal domain-containing protein n=1 Tax=Citrus sinensis TaxID=2711 RepID=A0A067GF94_CITSI|nr:hypothetical protein CISIN_1g001070mg [Citrus sinensis]
MSSQSQSQSPNQNQKQFDMRNWFPPYPPPSSSAAGDNFFPYPPPPPPPPPEPHANMHPHPYPHGPHRLLPYTPLPTTTVVSPNAGPQILALLNNNKSKHVGSTAPIYGKRVFGDYVAYDVDAVEEGREPTQQLEVNPITKYGSDPELLIGRQIAVNKHYVCYGLKGGNVRVLNLNTATRSLLRGHTKIKIWEDSKVAPLIILKPHGGQPVNSAQYLTAPNQAGHIILVTAGPLNREVKLWASASEEGWSLPTHAESWKCTQTLDLKSSAKPRVEEAFFNQVVVLSQAGLLLFANAKKNAIYSVHLGYGNNSAATRIDYIAEFTVTMPVLSFTGTIDPPSEHIIKLYCVQTQAIQQYSLNLFQCLPPPAESGGLERPDSSVSNDANGSRLSEFLFPSSTSKPSFSETTGAVRYPQLSTSHEATTSQENLTSKTESQPLSLARTTSDTNVVCVASPPLPLSPSFSRKHSGSINPPNSSELGSLLNEPGGSQPIIDSSFDGKTDTTQVLSHVPSLDSDANNDKINIAPNDISRALNPSMFKHPTHLITPSEILMSASSSETTNIIGGKNEEEVVVNSDAGNAEVEVKVLDETRFTHDEFGSRGESQNLVSENREKYLRYQATDPRIGMAAKCAGTSAETCVAEEAQEVDGAGIMETLAQPPCNDEAEVEDSTQDLDGGVSDSTMTTTFAQTGASSAKGKKQKEKKYQASSQCSPSSTVLNLANLSNEPAGSSSLPSAPAAFSQVIAMQDMLNQLMTMQKELQKQMSNLVTLPVTKEGRRLEASLGRGIEKAVKASTDALWARFHEENARNEKLLRDRTQQITGLITNLINKDLTASLEKLVKKELAAVGPAIVRTISPSIEKTITSAIVESFQRGVGDKAVNQLERSVNSRLEATVGRQIQAQFQTSGKHALQDALKSSVEASVIPAFEKSCKAMFEQVDATFQKGMVEHTTATLQHFESTHSPLALVLRESVNSVSSMAQTLSGEFVDGQRKLFDLAGVRNNTSAFNPSVPLSNGPLLGLHEKVEATMDPTKELSRLVSDRKYEEAFTTALQRSDVSIVSWLCSQVDMHGLLSMVPLPLSQGVLLSLLQQLACDINKDTARKLAWLTDVAAAINPADPMIAVHARPIFEQVYQRLHHQRSSPTISGAELSSIRLLIHVINSMLMTFK